MKKELVNSPSQEEEDRRGRKGGKGGKRMEGGGGRRKERREKEERRNIQLRGCFLSHVITRPRAASFFLPRYGSL